MSARRLLEVARQDLVHNLRRPLFWMQILILGLFIAELSGGHASIGSGDARVGGTKAWINSEFANAQLIVLLFAAMYVFFISVGAGMSLIRDDELKVGEMLHSTRLTPGEYVWGKFLAVALSFVGVLAMQVLLQIFFIHGLPHGANADYIGPLNWGAYLRPMLIFGLPALLLFCGACFAVGSLTRQPVLVFALPIGVLVLGISFLWDWSPVWLSPAVNRALQFADLTGYR
ncbi:MAG: ABC transporter permease, partial [Candidatus Eiseniibacteriota bacterium]